MNAFRFSLRWLLAAVAFIAVGLVSLRYASKLASDCLFIAWFALLLIAVLGIAYRRECQRAFWFGYCVFGWSFAAYVYFGHGNTICDRAIQSAYDSVTWSQPAPQKVYLAHQQSGGVGQQLGVSYRIYFPRLFPFLSAGRSLSGMIIAILGGLIAKWFHATRDNPK